MAACGVAVRAKDIEGYCDEAFYSALEMWFRTKLWGLAHGGGWATEPIDYIDAITALESENNRMEAEEIDSKTKKVDKVNVKEDFKQAPG